MNSMIASLDKDFQEELIQKQAMIDLTHAQLREASKTLAELRKQLSHTKKQINLLGEIQQRCRNTRRAIEAEDADFHGYSDTSTDTVNGNRVQQLPVAFVGAIDADAPFIVDAADYDSLPPVAILQARVTAYRRNTAVLHGLADSLNDKSSELEQKCRKVVSLCTGVEEGKVDSLLEGLLQAVESDGDQNEIDVNRVAGFLKIVQGV